MLIPGEGNRFLQDNKLDNLFNNHPEKAAAVVGCGLNLIYLLSAVSYPFMPAVAHSICEQLNAPLRSIPDTWIPEAAYLFSAIGREQEEEWRSKYGGKQEIAVVDDKKKGKKGKKAPRQQKAEDEQAKTGQEEPAKQ